MATSVGGVYLDFVADTTKFISGMQDAVKSANSTTASINKALLGVNVGFNAISTGVGKVGSVIGGLTGITTKWGAVMGSVAAGGLVYLTKSSLDLADDIGKVAERVGVTTDVLQGLQYGARQADVSTQDFTNSLDSFNKNLGLARLGTGDMVTFLASYDRGTLAALQHTKDTGQALLVLSDAVKKETDASKQRALVQATLGKSDADMINFLKKGSDELNNMAARAKDLGLIIDGNLIKNAAKANDDMKTLSDTVQLRFTAAVVQLAPQIDLCVQALIRFTEWAAKAFSPTDLNNIDQVTEKITQLQNVINHPPPFFGLLPGAKDMQKQSLAQLTADRDRLLSEQQKAKDMLAAGSGPAELGPTVDTKKNNGDAFIKSDSDALKAVQEQIRAQQQLVAAARQGDDAFREQQLVVDATSKAFDKQTGTLNKGLFQAYMQLGHAQQAVKDARFEHEVELEVDQTNQLNDALHVSLKAYQDMQIAIDAQNKVRAEGISLSSQEGQNLEKIIIENEKHNQQIQDASKYMVDYKAIAESAGDSVSKSFEDLIFNGGKAIDVVRSLISELAKMVFEQTAGKAISGYIAGALGAMTGAGGGSAAGASAGSSIASWGSSIAAMFADGGIMTPKGPLPVNAYAGGGVATGPQVAVFGEGRSNEAYVPLPDGKRIPVAMQGGGGGNTQHITIDARGHSSEVIDNIQRSLKALDANFETRAIGSVVNASRRNPKLLPRY